MAKYVLSVDQSTQGTKALIFGDDDRAAQIMHTEDPALMQKIARDVEGYDEDVWEGTRQLVAYRALKAKFSQNALLRERLLATGDAVLAECATKDRIWGIGMNRELAQRLPVEQWNGENLLGCALMEVRDWLQTL